MQAATMSPHSCGWIMLFGMLLGLHVLKVVSGIITTTVASDYYSGPQDLTLSLNCYVTGLPSAFSKSAGVGLVSYSIFQEAVASGRGFISYSSYTTNPSYMTMFGPAGRQLVEDFLSTIGTTTYGCFPPFSQVVTGPLPFAEYRDQLYWSLPSTLAQTAGLLFFLSLRDLYPLKHMAIIGFYNGASNVLTMVSAIGPVLGVTKMQRYSYSASVLNSIVTNEIRIVYQHTRADGGAPEAIASLVSTPALIEHNITVATTVELAYMTQHMYISSSSSGNVIPPKNIVISMPILGIDLLLPKILRYKAKQIGT